jgi:hypothetical protein
VKDFGWKDNLSLMRLIPIRDLCALKKWCAVVAWAFLDGLGKSSDDKALLLYLKGWKWLMENQVKRIY